MTRRTLVALLCICLLALAATPVPACPFCTAEGLTLTAELNQAQMVLAVRLVSADRDRETTKIEIETVIKDHAVRGKKTELSVARYIDPEPLGPNGRFLVFCDVYKGKIDPYRGMFMKKGSKLPDYCKELLKTKDESVSKRLKVLFKHLDSADFDISNDAFKEYAYADYKDLRDVYKDLPGEKILKWIKDPETPSARMGLYASMLGHCGTEKDATELRKILEDPDRKAGSGIDGALAGYIMLRPKEGWAFTSQAMKNSKEDFYYRYAVLRAIRFIYEFRTDIISKKQIVQGHVALLGQKDIADLLIEDLRKWGCFDAEVANQVMAVAGTAAHDQMIVKRALLRYALQCKNNTSAASYIAMRKKEDAEAVADAQELLDIETSSAKKDKPAASPKK